MTPMFFRLFKDSASEFGRLKSLAGLGMCLALGVVINLFGSFYITATLKLSLGFLVLALIGMLYGPVCGFAAGTFIDVICYLLYPNGPYFIGFTLTTALTGMMFGLFLYRFRTELWRIIVSRTLINLLLNLLLNSLWLTVLYGQAFWAMLPSRIFKNVVLLPVEVALLWLILTPASKLLKNKV